MKFFPIIRPAWILILLLASLPAFAAEAWVLHARRLTGESGEVRHEAMSRLRDIPKLNEVLQKGLRSSHRFLALDVVTALKLRSMLPFLLEFLEEDATGYAIHSLNTLLQPADYARVFRLYRERLGQRNTSAANQVAILDSFSRTSERLGETLLRHLLRDGSPEVRSSVLLYLRNQILIRKQVDYLPLVFRALEDPAYQNRLQTYALVSELSGVVKRRHRKEVKEVAEACAREAPPEAQTFCGVLEP